MIAFTVKNPVVSYSDYLFMYQRAKGSTKGSLKVESFTKKLRTNNRIVLPNSVFTLDENEPVMTKA
jgi:hypothetical protein